MVNYETCWQFWLDDACYKVARGARYLDIPSEVSESFWLDVMLPKIHLYEQTHDVVIRFNFGEIQVARYSWIFKLLDCIDGDSLLHDALVGVLLGYDAEKIEQFLVKERGLIDELFINKFLKKGDKERENGC